jgi:hypothetical protein
LNTSFINPQESVMGQIKVSSSNSNSKTASSRSRTDLVVKSPKIDVLANRFKQFSRKTAEGILEMARAVNEARQLTPSEFLRFCELVKMKTSSIKKLAVVGAKYEYLIARADKLPANWTTVYAVAKLANEEIQTLIDNGVVNSLTVVRDLKAATGKTTTKTTTKPTRITAPSTPAATATDLSFHVQLVAPNAAAREVFNSLLGQLRALQMQAEVQVKVSVPLQDFLQAT